MLLTTSVVFAPELSAKARGMASRATANFLTAYCSNPGRVSAYCRRLWASSISTAPAPGRNLKLFSIELK